MSNTSFSKCLDNKLKIISIYNSRVSCKKGFGNHISKSKIQQTPLIETILDRFHFVCGLLHIA